MSVSVRSGPFRSVPVRSGPFRSVPVRSGVFRFPIDIYTLIDTRKNRAQNFPKQGNFLPLGPKISLKQGNFPASGNTVPRTEHRFRTRRIH